MEKKINANDSAQKDENNCVDTVNSYTRIQYKYQLVSAQHKTLKNSVHVYNTIETIKFTSYFIQQFNKFGKI